MHRRTALSVSAVLLAAAPLLSACSSDARPGTAAVVGGERITTSALQVQVNDVRTAQSRSAQSAQAAGTARLERMKLNNMIQLRILEKTAKDAGITVTTREIEDVRKDTATQSGGAQKMEQLALARRLPVAPDQIDEDIRFQLLLGKIREKFGDDAFVPALTKASGALHIEVNPRYGGWDAKQIALGEGETPWITQRTRPEQPPAGV
ncbi:MULTISPECIES: SurA N-terminal domain-containing protein [unclassified Streptomyces]|uniref:SurA N-terminal domain-containing protein n=1 Tax=unclassified Streptomyces TaxID=2593676 RepID=UPI002259C3E8|nr:MULTISPECIES: SurA N-terminal domain-containing protein [unclassified Streptomyces]MCX4526211.1 SurA N-terminal domain-containing protein [Streptomyces sp. NBC_01551]MCX4543224.1 SurA N-terminal domain-containing protein [Streptomyces sp. NBC_01565]